MNARLTRNARIRFVGALLWLFLVPRLCHAEIEITLKNTFIEKFKNKATIEATFTVDKAHERPNSPSKDGDLHIAGRAPQVGLPTVAEIMNAKDEDTSVDAIHAAERSGDSIKITGAWRLWCEHGGNSTQVQGARLTKFDTTNPDHVFEIHPVTRLNDGSDLLDSLKPISGFKAKDAHDAFVRYENIRSKIEPKATTTKITTNMAGFNYVKFVMELNEDPRAISDGTMVFAQVRDLDGELLVRNRRMVFVKGTEPDDAVKGIRKGSCLTVLGIPRINLTLVSWRINNFTTRPEVLQWNLPYEIIVVAVFGPPSCPE